MMRWGQHAAGMGFSILKDTRDIPHLEGAWLKNVQDGLNTIGSEHRCGSMTRTLCWLPMEHLSDIVTSDGTAIHPMLLQTIKEQLNNQFQTVAWMKQKKPNK
eukprot:1888906-Ditylum_brightwellii.AAC.1